MTYKGYMAIFNRQQCKSTKIKERHISKQSNITNHENTDISNNYFKYVKYSKQI
jgi:hypothetical protein